LAKKTHSTFAKRQKELARQARQRDKQARRFEKKADADSDPLTATTSEDRDLIGIEPGPQPPVDEVETERGGDPDQLG
jgi:hypothetical protein